MIWVFSFLCDGRVLGMWCNRKILIFYSTFAILETHERKNMEEEIIVILLVFAVVLRIVCIFLRFKVDYL